MRGFAAGSAERKLTRPRDAGCRRHGVGGEQMRLASAEQRPPHLGIHADRVAHELDIGLAQR
jgi:hypothetical protein